MPLTNEQMEAIETEAEIAEVISMEDEMQGAGVFVPPMPRDGEEADELVDRE